MGFTNPLPVDEKMGRPSSNNDSRESRGDCRLSYELIVCLLAIAIYFGTTVSPPSLMDDVDAVQALIARGMLESGDWVTARLNGVADWEKPPLIYWMIASSFAVFGISDWAARIPIALSCVLLCWLTFRIGAWAFSLRTGFYAGIALSTCVGLFLFTRILISDVVLTLAITLTLWSMLRALEENEPRPRLWAALMAFGLAAGVLLKGLIGVAIPGGAAFLYLACARQLFLRRTWQRLRPISGFVIFLLLTVPWHALATFRNPPYFDFTLSTDPFRYRGFFWFYFINEHVLRFLNLRHPRDYDTVPRLWFWLSHLLWLFPWSVYLPAAAQQSFQPSDRAGRARLMILCWTAFVLLFFTFSTTQEYYSMPIYPALALLIGAAMDKEGKWISWGTRAAAVIVTLAAIAAIVILFVVRNAPAPGDITTALTRNPDAYTLSLGHIQDLTLPAFAYLRFPLLLAAFALLIGAAGTWLFRNSRGFLALAMMMLIFVHAARTAMVVFDPYLSSRPLAEALRKVPHGKLIVNGAFFEAASVFFYAPREGLLLNGRYNNLEYGSYAPGAPPVFIEDEAFNRLWLGSERYYLLVTQDAFPRLHDLVGDGRWNLVAESSGKLIYTNHQMK